MCSSALHRRLPPPRCVPAHLRQLLADQHVGAPIISIRVDGDDAQRYRLAGSPRAVA